MSAQPDELVEVAEQEAREAAGLAQALEERIREGDESVTPDELEHAKGLARFSRLRQEAATRKAARVREDARVKACKALVAEVRREAARDSARYAAQAQSASDALEDLVSALVARNEQISAWMRRAAELGVPESANGQSDHGKLGWLPYPAGPAIVAGDLRLNQTDPVGLVGLLLGEVQQRLSLSRPFEQRTAVPGTVVAELAKIGQEPS